MKNTLVLSIVKGFTFIEILVVVTIISLLAAVGAVSYSQFSKQSRDARRKADLEQIRSAIELYKSNSSSNLYPLTGTANLVFTSCSMGALTDGTNTYMSKIPNDPKCTTSIYYYASATGSTYTMAAQLETTSSCTSPPGGNSCGTGNPCNYCLGPYGQQ